MEDTQIIALYWDRNEEAIHQTDLSYGRKLHVLSNKIVNSYEDAQECVNDTYLKAWNSIPPQRPSFFFAYLAKICRFFAYGILDWRRAAKRNADVVELTKEMEMCIPDNRIQLQLDGEELAEILNRFLEGLPKDSRLIFLRRYWYADSVAEIADRYRISQSKVKTQLHRTRNKLRIFLEKEGITV